MRPLKRLSLLLIFSAQQFKGEDNQAKKKNKNADPVDAMHITYPFIFWPVRIFFTKEKVFRYLFPDSHTKILFYTTMIY